MEFTPQTLLRAAGDAMAGLFRHAAGFEADLRRETWTVRTDLGHSLANWLALVEPGPVAEARLRAFVTHLRANRRDGVVYLTGAAHDPVPLCSELGLHDPYPVPLMVARPEDLPPRRAHDLTIEVVTASATLRAAARVVAAAFQMPPEESAQLFADGVLTEPAVRFYAAARKGQVQGVAVVSRIGVLLYVDIMATLPACQGQGIGRALLEHALAEDAAQGARCFFLIASAEGKPLYERLGFRTVLAGLMRSVGPGPAGSV